MNRRYWKRSHKIQCSHRKVEAPSTSMCWLTPGFHQVEHFSASLTHCLRFLCKIPLKRMETHCTRSIALILSRNGTIPVFWSDSQEAADQRFSLRSFHAMHREKGLVSCGQRLDITIPGGLSYHLGCKSSSWDTTNQITLHKPQQRGRDDSSSHRVFKLSQQEWDSTGVTVQWSGCWPSNIPTRNPLQGTVQWCNLGLI